MLRILRRAKSAMVSLAAFSNSRSPKAPRNGRPPRSQASSYCRSRSSGRGLQRRLHVERKIETGRPSARLGPQRRIVRLGRLQVFRRQAFVAGRHRPCRRALEHREASCLLRDDRDRLDRRGAGADHADPQPGEVDTVMRPFAGVIDRPAKILHAREFRTVRRRQAADRHDAEFCAKPCRRDRSRCASIFRLSSNVAAVTRVSNTISPAQVEAVGDMVGVGRGFQAAARTSPTSSTPGPAPPRRRTSTACSRRRSARPDSGSSTRCRRRRCRPRTPAPKSRARAGDAACTCRQSRRRRRRRRKPLPLRAGAPSSPDRGVGRHDACRLPAGRLTGPCEAPPQHSPRRFSIRRFRWPPMRRRDTAGALPGRRTEPMLTQNSMPRGTP